MAMRAVWHKWVVAMVFGAAALAVSCPVSARAEIITHGRTQVGVLQDHSGTPPIIIKDPIIVKDPKPKK